jgi:oligopeptidase B
MDGEERDTNMTKGAAVSSAGGVGVQPPLAMREPVEHVIHGDRRVDHYAWMREKSDPRVKEYLEAENAFADSVMRATEGLQEKLYQEMLGRIQQTDLSVPYLLRGYWYYTRTEEGKQYAIYCRKAAGGEVGGEEKAEQEAGVQLPPSAEEVLLDLNEMVAGHTFMGLGLFEVSDNNQRLAYATDTTGFRQYVLEVKELGEGVPAEDVQQPGFKAERVTSAAWAADNRTLFYVTEDAVTKRSNQLWRVEPGGVSEASAKPELIYEERDERFRMDVQRSRSGAYLFLEINSHTTSEARYLRADTPEGPFQLMAERENDHEYYVDHHPGGASDPWGGVFFIRTNSNGRTYRLMTAPTVDPVRSRWREVIPNRPKVMLAGLEAFRTHLVLLEREDGLPYLRVVDLTRQARSALLASKRIEFAEPTYNAMISTNPEFDTGHVRYVYESLVTPRSVYDYEVKSGERVLQKQQPVLGNFDSRNYMSERLHAKAKDGTMIPISIVRRRDTFRDGNAALLLYGYGSYGFSMSAAFNSNRLSLLDRGMVFAIAHVRGGGELGKPWHDAGRMHRKMNTFTDFIDCTEFLIAKRYTSEGQVAIEGGSAGGLLMGAVTNMQPNLFRVVVSHVPFVDVLNTMLDPKLPLTVGEYEEWGNPEIEEDYCYIRQYCPYTNVEHKVYPRMLVKTAWNDSQVMYWEAAKYVAKLRAMKTDANTLLLKTNMGAGHGGASGRYDYLREIALDYAFLLRELGMAE